MLGVCLPLIDVTPNPHTDASKSATDDLPVPHSRILAYLGNWSETKCSNGLNGIQPTAILGESQLPGED